jgi:hypothetical protein
VVGNSPTETSMPESARTSRVGRVTNPAPAKIQQAQISPLVFHIYVSSLIFRIYKECLIGTQSRGIVLEDVGLEGQTRGSNSYPA